MGGMDAPSRISTLRIMISTRLCTKYSKMPMDEWRSSSVDEVVDGDDEDNAKASDVELPSIIDQC